MKYHSISFQYVTNYQIVQINNQMFNYRLRSTISTATKCKTKHLPNVVCFYIFQRPRLIFGGIVFTASVIVIALFKTWSTLLPLFYWTLCAFAAAILVCGLYHIPSHHISNEASSTSYSNTLSVLQKQWQGPAYTCCQT